MTVGEPLERDGRVRSSWASGKRTVRSNKLEDIRHSLCSPGLNLVLLPARSPSAAHPSPNT
ncbi:hypothetical protein M405DRAFT_835601, partial [Rhizopogon salebrosus TDB-379]